MKKKKGKWLRIGISMTQYPHLKSVPCVDTLVNINASELELHSTGAETIMS